jgi:hypothetical protein
MEARSMTRKDFELIATAIREYGAQTGTAQFLLAGIFADALAATNPRFDRARFIEAATS